MDPVAVRMTGITKRFSGIRVLQGVYTPDEGQIAVDGNPVEIRSPHDARALGIGMIFQEFSLIPTLTVAQNIFLGREPRGSGGLIDDRASARRARELFAELEEEIDPNATMIDLGTGYWQLTEIAKALAQDARVLIMDEPTSSLTMNNVIDAIVGKSMEQAFEWQERSVDRSVAPLLQVRNVSAGKRVQDISFDLYPGEILGLAGLMGSGRTELARAIFGIDRIDRGEILIRGERADIGNPEEAIAAGVSLVPEDRRIQGLVLDHSVKNNLLLPLLDRLDHAGIIDDRRGDRMAGSIVADLRIKTGSIATTVRLLSGGNQQKVVIGKWLATEPDILIMDEPTAGVDIQAKTEILGVIRALADRGKGIIVISSELVELLAVSDRLLVLRDGHVVREIDRREIRTEEELHRAVQG